ncbi:MAG: MBL fold metallo-hydrolase [Bacteroidales bacterium]|nr:MBL fold metallo-hydrolase [Bacteroidales bacterium]
MSLSIHNLIFNAFQVNSYLVYSKNGDCLIVDPACYSQQEQQQLTNFISEHNLTPVRLINTHSHVDHVLGNNFVFKTYGLRPEIHKAGLIFHSSIIEHAAGFGFIVDTIVEPAEFLEDQQKITVGGETIEIAYTPGHADGSICLKYDKGKWVITGDLIFEDSIGRTDLPTGDLNTLLCSIHQKIFVIDDSYTLYPGHGRPTTVGYEKKNNPFL